MRAVGGDAVQKGPTLGFYFASIPEPFFELHDIYEVEIILSVNTVM
jgi:hypothetical protein